MAFDTAKWRRDAKSVILRWEKNGTVPTPAMYAMIEACDEIDALRRYREIVEGLPEGTLGGIAQEAVRAD